MNIQSFEIDNWEELQMGIVLDESDKWLLVKRVTEDYYTDGFCVYNKHFVLNRVNGLHERFYERVLKLKNEPLEKPLGFQFTDTIGLLKWCQDEYGLFELQDDDETCLSIGRINSVFDNTLIIDFITSKGLVEVAHEYEIDLLEIRVVSFSSHYFNAIRLLWMDENNITSTP